MLSNPPIDPFIAVLAPGTESIITPAGGDELCQSIELLDK